MSGKKRRTRPASLEECHVSDPDVQMWQAIQRRAGLDAAYPDQAAISAMEEPLRRLMGAAMLFSDVAVAYDNVPERIDPIRVKGLIFLALAMECEAERVYRLYHGPWADRS